MKITIDVVNQNNDVGHQVTLEKNTLLYAEIMKLVDAGINTGDIAVFIQDIEEEF